MLSAATFGWLCVETPAVVNGINAAVTAATFGWLCVETTQRLKEETIQAEQPPSGGCVLKLQQRDIPLVDDCSHLRVAVC